MLAYGTNSTTGLVASISQPTTSGTAMHFAYTYDVNGNIASETRNWQTTTYVYDALGQLIRVNDPHENATWVYNYDRGGNITSKVQYAYTTGTPGTARQTTHCLLALYRFAASVMPCSSAYSITAYRNLIFCVIILMADRTDLLFGSV